MKPCPHCAAQLPEAAKFCGSCGNAVDSAIAPTSVTPLVPTLGGEPAAPSIAAAPTRPAAPQPPPVARPSSAAPPPPGGGGGVPRKTIAIAAAVLVVLGGGAAAAVALSGGGSEDAKVKTVVVTSPPTAPADAGAEADAAAADEDERLRAEYEAQVERLDELMQLSTEGRTAAIEGDREAAIANRSELLAELRDLRHEAEHPTLQKGLGELIAAIRESLRQNRECGAACTTAELRRVGRLKRDALRTLNPLLKEQVGRTYRREEI